ncbi:MAG: hypothetical protein H7A46_15685 [Verrucomicrobiales bacterium]|nr:hypothetical protein [Verrucomicrobiales bacterium]
MTIRITEVIDRSPQGITRPFLCRAEDEQQYFVKGRGAGNRALISEWLAGNLGLRLDLPIPPIAKVLIPNELIQFSAREDIPELGAGIGFGSRVVANVDELTYLFIGQIAPRVRARILLFDWWVCNGDRTLTPDGGNPNLLWCHRDQKLHVIDQNLAFEDATMHGFWEEHIFRDSVIEWTADFRDEMSGIMVAAIADLPRLWDQIPESWTEVDSGLSLASVRGLLSRFERDPGTFWKAQ